MLLKFVSTVVPVYLIYVMSVGEPREDNSLEELDQRPFGKYNARRVPVKHP